MEIVSVTSELHHRYMILSGWDTVVGALSQYASGKVPGSKATVTQTASETRDGGGAFLLLREMSATPPGVFVQRLAEEARDCLASRDLWDKSFDYDGQGPFFKTTVSFVVLDRARAIYGLGFYAAYVGEKPEREFAQTWQVPLTLVRGSVIIKAVPDEASGHFSLDCANLLERLCGVLPVSAISAREMSRQMATVPDRHSDPEPYRLCSTDFYAVDVSIDDLTVEPYWKETWRVDGSTVIGGLRRDRRLGCYEQPTFRIDIRKRGTSDTRADKDVFWQEEEKATVCDLVERIVAALQA